MTTFNLTITLGNAEMSHSSHVAAAVREAAEQVEGLELDLVDEAHRLGRPIYDLNGNRVGDWIVSL